MRRGVLVWDEYGVDENPAGFDEDVAQTKKKHEAEMVAMQVITIEVNTIITGQVVLKGEV